MNKDIARRWVDALRSGEYEQAIGTLARVNDNGKIGYCCLGVLCELAVQDGAAEPKEQDEVLESRFAFEGMGALPPESVRVWAGLGGDSDDVYLVEVSPEITADLKDRFGEVQPREGTGHLPNLNDDLRLSFNQIADLIEATHLNEEN